MLRSKNNNVVGDSEGETRHPNRSLSLGGYEADRLLLRQKTHCRDTWQVAR